MTRTPTAQEIDHHLDHLKHDKPSARLRSVAYLTSYLDTLLTLGVIPEEYRDGIKATVDQTRAVHGLPDLGLRGRVDA